MSEIPQLNWIKPRTLKKNILEWGCEEYEELVALRTEVCVCLTDWLKVRDCAEAEGDSLAGLRGRVAEERIQKPHFTKTTRCRRIYC